MKTKRNLQKQKKNRLKGGLSGNIYNNKFGLNQITQSLQLFRILLQVSFHNL